MPENETDFTPSAVFDAMASEFAQQLREGKSPDIAEFANRDQELAARIQRLFPILEMMERNGRSEDWSEADLLKAEQEFQKLDGEKWEAPKQLGDFRLIRQIGRGGMGVVYEAEQQSLGRHVAIKILPESAQFDERRTERFATEAKASAMLHHTNIVPVFGIGREDGLSFIVMQYIQGQPLSVVLRDIARVRDLSSKPLANHDESTFSNRHIVRSMFGESIHSLADQSDVDAESQNQKTAQTSKPRNPSNGVRALSGSESGSLLQSHSNDSRSVKVRNYFRNVARVGVRVSEALDHAHSYGILHRDIKPSNLLLDEQGAVWVTDFGLAKHFDSPDLTRTGEVVGTLRYMSPEQLDSNASSSSDIFGLGLTLYEMLTLQPAYPGSDRKRLIEKVSEANPAVPRSIDSRIPRDLETIVMKCIHSEPSKRYATAAEVADDLNRFLDGQPIFARRIGVIEKAWKWCCRRPTLAASFAALLLSIMLGVAGVGWQWNETVAALKKSKEATQKAEKHYNQARSAVVQITESISTEELLSSPSLQPIRGKLLRKALAYQVEFADTHPDDIGIQVDLARAYENLAKVSFEAEQTKEALDYLDEVSSILKPLQETDLSPKERVKVTLCLSESMTIRGSIMARKSPDGHKLFAEAAEILLDGREKGQLNSVELFSLARIYQRIGLSYEAMGASRSPEQRKLNEQALDYYSQAFELANTISADDETVGDHGELIASLHRDLGVANRHSRNFEKALEHYKSSVDQFRSLVDSDPRNTEHRYGLAEALSSLGHYYGFTENKHDVGISFYTQAIEQYRILSLEYPSVLRFTESQSRASLNCGMLCEDENRLDKAFEFRAAAVKLNERSLLFAPESAKLISSHGKSLMGLGVNCAYREDNEAALDCFAQARAQQELAIEKSPNQPIYQIRRVRSILQTAQTHRDMGNFARSRDACLDAIKSERPPMEAIYLASRELLRLALEIKVNVSDSDSKELEIAEESIAAAKEHFVKLAMPKLRTRQRILNDNAFEEVIASDMGEEFLEWFEGTTARLANANQ